MRRYAWVLLPCLLLGLVPLLIGATTADKGYMFGKYALELDNVLVGWVQSVEGGQATAEVITERLESDNLQKKHLGNVKYEDITITVGADMSKALYEWIQSMTAGQSQRKSGAIIVIDSAGREVSRLNFHNALITEVGMPALDAASKDAARITIKLAPEYTRRVRGSGVIIDVPIKGAAGQKQWLPANFRLRIDGLEDATARVNKIEALVIKQKVTEPAGGEAWDPWKEPASVEIPNLVITLAESDADPLYDWQEDFIIRRNNTDGMEKGGTLEYLASDRRTVLFTLHFEHLGIFKIAPDKMESNSEQIRRVKVEMYCEDIRFR